MIEKNTRLGKSRGRVLRSLMRVPLASAIMMNTAISGASSMAVQSNPATWRPDANIIRDVESAARQASIEGPPFDDRVRLYAPTLKAGTRIIRGVLTPARKKEASQRDSESGIVGPEVWKPGAYVVELNKLPFPTVVVATSGCEWMIFDYDIEKRSITSSLCR